MNTDSSLKFKVASEDWEFDQIHRLNYRTFVEEIPQHSPNAEEALVDKFHRENTYIICLHGDKLVGMVALRANRPFSLDGKLENLDSYLPPDCVPCEVRLLSVEKGYRHTRVFYGLLATLTRHFKEHGYHLGVISGTVRQLRLYKHLGFVPFGPLVGKGEALYQPMCLRVTDFMERAEKIYRSTSTPPAVGELVNLLPGPVSVSRRVRQSFAEAPVSHRSQAFMLDFDRTKQLLCQLVGTEHVEVFTGSGTLANDVVAGQLSLLPGRGLILSSGEFGSRLIDHATRVKLSFDTLELDWGQPFDRAEIARKLDGGKDLRWLWAVHCETSTGILNDLPMLQEVCAERDVRLCLDCISSIGTVPVDLGGVYLATCVSGKALRSFPGLSMVFYSHDVRPAPEHLARYLDLGYYAEKDGVPFTIPSNLVYALHTALKSFRDNRIFDQIVHLSTWLRSTLRDMGLTVVTPDEHAAPAVITLAAPDGMDSEELGRLVERAGYLLSYRSYYLLERGWLQICLMGECAQDEVSALVDELRELTASPPATPSEAAGD